MAKQRDTKNKIFDTCVRLFSERGYSNVTTKEIAKTAGLSSEGVLYYHYPSKESILISILDMFKIRTISYIIPPARTNELLDTEPAEKLLRRFIQVFHRDEAELMLRCFRIALMEEHTNRYAKEIISEYHQRQATESIEYVLRELQKRKKIPGFNVKSFSALWCNSIFGQAVHHVNALFGNGLLQVPAETDTAEYLEMGESLVKMALSGKLPN